MKTNKKGFTLIELLAVIVILAIIALIATPMILGVIDSARKGATESSAYGYIEAVEKSTLQGMLDNPDAVTLADGEYTIGTGGTTVTHDTTDESINVLFKGESPESGTFTVAKGIITNASLKYKSYDVAYDGKKATATK